MGDAVPGTVVPPARVALVTGGTRGIGLALALGLAAAGLRVGVLGRDPDRVAAAVERLGDVGPAGRRAGDDRGAAGRSGVTGVAADVTDLEQVRDAVRHVEERLGGIDLLVNNAGVIDTEVPLWEADPDEWWSVVETNLRGPFHLDRAVVPGMLERGGGRVVDLSSGAGSHDTADASAYNASKTAITRLGAHLHLAGFDRGLRSFELSPGSVRTDMTLAMRLHEGRSEWTPVEDVVAMVLAIARGDLDAWSGSFLRVTHDTPELLRAAADAGRPGDDVRRLRVTPWGGDDPMPPGVPAR